MPISGVAGEIIFRNSRGADYVVGECASLMISRDTVFISRRADPLARLRGTQWLTEQGVFTRLDCECPVMIHFQRAESLSERFGYQHFSSVNGVAYGDHRVIAFYDSQNNDWYSGPTETHWEAIFVDLQTPS